MTPPTTPTGRPRARSVAVALALTLLAGAAPLAAQNGALEDFDLRPRATPSPQPPVVGPDDPENPTVRPRPRPEPTVAPTATAPPVAAAPPAQAAPRATGSAAVRAPARRAEPSAASPRDTSRAAPIARDAPDIGEIAPRASSEPAAVAPPPAAPVRRGPYVPRNLDAADDRGSDPPWLLLALLGATAAALGAWFAWSRRDRRRYRAASAPEIERPRLPSATVPPPQPAPPVAPPPASEAPVLALALHATRMSATLVNATLSYRLAVTNNGPVPLREVSVAGDMIGAHASRPAEELLGAAGIELPPLHAVAALAPGESVELRGDIRLPLVAITPIRRGPAALFVPLARLRARGFAPDGAPVEGGGTFLVGQEPDANARLQPFRLDLGPRNYSQIGQQLLPVPA
ncbi:MAG: hypothetical protein ABW194_08670 [Novosphingobium sp.]